MYSFLQVLAIFHLISARISAWFFPQPLEMEYNRCLKYSVLLGVDDFPFSEWMGKSVFVFQDPWASPYCCLQNIFVKYICKCHAE